MPPRAAFRLAPPAPLALAFLVCLALAFCAACAGPARGPGGQPSGSSSVPPSAPGTLNRAAALLEDSPGLDPQAALEMLAGHDEPEARLLAVRALRLLGRFDEAVAECNRLILREPRLARAFVERGLTFSALGHAERGLEDLRAALVLAPGDIDALLVQGDIFFMLERPAAAEDSYSQAIALAPERPLAWINRGVARDEQGRFEEAIADFTQALALDPAQASALANRGVSRSQTGDMRGMCEDYARACALGQCRRLLDARAMGYCDLP